jgi:hypothetical protein
MGCDRNTQAAESSSWAGNAQRDDTDASTPSLGLRSVSPESRPCVRVAGSGADPATCPAMATVVEPMDKAGEEVGTASMRLSLTVFGCHVTVQCEDAETRALLVANYGDLQSPLHPGDVSYVVSRPRHQKGAPLFCIGRAGQAPLLAAEAGEFLWLFEKDMTIALQQLRPDLYFVHAGVLAFRHRAFMLVGPSGSGKSTTTWALSHHGCRYLSDELGAIDLRTRDVLPYPHAICLKQAPPPAYPLPDQTLCTAHTWHIPAAALLGGVSHDATPLMAVFFLQYRREASHPTICPLSQAAATARLLANALNPLAHPEAGLDGAITLMSGVVPFELFSADLTATCALIIEALGRVATR